MSRYRRATTEGASYFFTVNTYRRRAILTHPAVRLALREAIEHTRRSLPFVIDAWVLLPDHLHTIWTLPEDDAAFGKRWGIIKSFVSRKCTQVFDIDEPRSESRIKRRENDFWQRRFWEHQLRDEIDYARHVDYIHFNPVKHGYVTRAIDWPYSTFHKFVLRAAYPDNWGVDPGDVLGKGGE